MRHGSLFSGIGGFDLASEWMGWDNVFQVEIDDYCQKVLAKNFPNVKRYGDIKEFKGQLGSVDILTGGFPCQPFSQAGKRKGKSDDRYLWPEYLRVIREIKPTYVVGENVAGLISMEDGKTLDGIFLDLEGEGYEIESFIIPACGVGAWHRRDRIWIIAYHSSIGRMDRESNKESMDGREQAFNEITSSGESREDVSNTNGTRCKTRQRGQESRIGRWIMERDAENRRYWQSEPAVGRVADGIPKRVDRLKGLGNAIVPQIAYELFKAISQ